MVDWRQECEKKGDGEKKEAGGGQHLTASVSPLTTESDMISTNKKNTQSLTRPTGSECCEYGDISKAVDG